MTSGTKGAAVGMTIRANTEWSLANTSSGVKWYAGQAMALADLDDLVNKTTGGGVSEVVYFFKQTAQAGSTTGITNGFASQVWNSLWSFDGYPTAGAFPTTTASQPGRATDGALGQIDPTGGRKKYLHNLAVMVPTAGDLLIYDRLMHSGGLVGNVTTAQTITGGTITRNTGGTNNMAWWEVYTTLTGGSLSQVTISYTNQSGTSGRTSTSKGEPTQLTGQAFALPLASGDNGIQAVASMTRSVVSTSAGNVGVTIGRPLGIVSCAQPRGGGFLGIAHGWMVEIPTDACLAFMFRPSSSLPTSAAGTYIHGAAAFVEA